jgi:carboxypeptidase Taq
MSNKYELLRKKLKRISDINYASAVLQWDQETYLPKNGHHFRAEQLATLSGIAHEYFTDPALEMELLELSTENDLTQSQKRNIELVLEEISKQKKYTGEFVETLSHAISSAFQAWNEAREANDANRFLPSLNRLVELKKEEAQLLGFEEHPYNALLNQYEKNLSVRELDSIFEQVQNQLHPLLEKINQTKQVDDHFFHQHFKKDSQWNFGIELLKQMGYDFESGRQDISAHPFTISFSPQDVRVTTRIDENNLSEMIWSCIHEGGHALYEQGLPFTEYGMPLSEAVSLGIHESQSRLWENHVGRSEWYWKKNFPELKTAFPTQLKNISSEDFFKACNKVEPSLIRTNADELTYHFHILIRYQLEKALIGGDLNTSDIRDAWNDAYQQHLGLKVPDDRHGVLQDVHWSHGSFGYFPTYSIGSFYAAQFFHAAETDLKKSGNGIESGQLNPLLLWLREKIHVHGKFYSARDLCTRICGESLNIRYFIDYAENKFKRIYNY